MKEYKDYFTGFVLNNNNNNSPSENNSPNENNRYFYSNFISTNIFNSNRHTHYFSFRPFVQNFNIEAIFIVQTKASTSTINPSSNTIAFCSFINNNNNIIISDKLSTTEVIYQNINNKSLRGYNNDNSAQIWDISYNNNESRIYFLLTGPGTDSIYYFEEDKIYNIYVFYSSSEKRIPAT